MKLLEQDITALEADHDRGSQCLMTSQRVLIVEDEPRNQLVLQDYLEYMGLQSDIANDGVEGLKMAQSKAYDLALLDIMMPGMNGYELLQRLKADARTREIPVVVISALDSMESVIRCLEMGAEDSLPKPFKRPLLRARVEACLDRKRLRDRELEMQTRDRQQLATIRRSYEQLCVAERSRDNLSNMIVHDLNSPLNAIMGYSDLIREQLEATGERSADSDIFPCLDQMGEAVKRMIELTRAILDVSKLENGVLEVNWQRLDLAGIARAVHDRFFGLADQHGIQLELQLEDEPPLVDVDRSLLQRVLENLVSNSLKYGSRYAGIRVERGATGKVRLEVVNDGHLISAADQDRVFDKYFQCEEKGRKSRQRYGVGLGLTFCKLAVDAMGAKIWTDNGSDDLTHFYIEFDLACPEEASVPS